MEKVGNEVCRQRMDSVYTPSRKEVVWFTILVALMMFGGAEILYV